MKIQYSKIIITCLVLVNFTINSIDNPHFYKATHFWEEPRFEKDDLNSFQFWFGGGKTATGYNGCKQKVNVLQIYGPENIAQLAHGIPEEILNKFPKTLLNTIWQKEPKNCDFGKIKFDGLFRMLELDLDFKKNFSYGLFGEIHMPFRKLEITDISYYNLTNSCDLGPDINYMQWLTFMANFKQNMQKYGININRSSVAGIGDTSLLIGFTKNYEDTEYIDFIDFTIKAGLVLPTGKTQNLSNPFALPLGYNGHLGFNGYLNISVGLYEWLTLDIFSSFIAFAKKTKEMRIKTAYEQNGFIKLAKQRANVHKGTIFSIGSYIKFDHMLNGFSVLLAYRFDKEFKTKLRLNNCSNFNTKIANSDELLQGWFMNTLNVIGEYDFATYENPNRPRLEVFCDFALNGKRIFRTDIFGLGFNIDYCW
ncbi:MAG: hypothetical protein P4L22_07885 [Candidatus Babeliales bacterium]|nr:hypothetical protein [Candidatus Babeliales bacterium]